MGLQPARLSSAPPRRRASTLSLAITLAVGLAACSSGPDAADVATAEADPIVAPVPISGIYNVTGVTKQIGGQDERRISGTVTLRQEGDQYYATFKLATTFPGASDPVHADVIGTGEGTISGRTLTGTTKTQLIVSTVPGIDTGFAFIPRIVGARVSSSVTSEIQPDGRVTIELRNLPAEGEDYIPTQTMLRGIRVADRATELPAVAARGNSRRPGLK